MKKICVTGTKGKTTIVRMLNQVLSKNLSDTLLVDTTGAYKNNTLQISLEQSKEIYGLVPSVCPGRFLYLTRDFDESSVAILESSLGSSALPGMGYKRHDIGIFSNVFEDHIGSSKRIQSKDDIAKAKDFVFQRIESYGYGILNGDDDFVIKSFRNVFGNRAAKNKLNLVVFGQNPKLDTIKSFYPDPITIITVQDGKLVTSVAGQDNIILDIKDVKWTFGGDFQPSVYNLMAVFGGLYAFYDGDIPSKVITDLTNSTFDSDGGRMTEFEFGGVKVLADYAHEKYSLKTIAEFAKKRSEGDVIGVLRLAYDRSDQLIANTGRFIADSFDKFIIYDKIDGKIRKPRELTKLHKFEEKVGYVSNLFASSIKETNDQVQVILSEDEALEEAARIAQPGDIVVHIVNDDIKQSLRFVNAAFGKIDKTIDQNLN